MYMPNARILRLEPKATYIPLNRVGVLQYGLTHIFKFALGVTQILGFLDINMLLRYYCKIVALGVQANASTQREWFCVAVEYRPKFS